MTRVYRLDIVYPEGSRQPGWKPAIWSDREFLATLSRKTRRALHRQEFRWPAERLFLSSSSASNRADRLRAYGAQVTVRPSDPVAWPA